MLKSTAIGIYYPLHVFLCLFFFQSVNNQVIAIPVLSSYPDISLTVSSDTVINPLSAHSGVTSLTATTSPLFQGVIVANPLNGVVRITNPKPAGNYVVTVNAGSGVTKTFVLTVSDPACSQAGFKIGGIASGSARPYNVAVGDFNEDGIQDVVNGNYSGSTLYISYGTGNGTFTFGGTLTVVSQTTAVAVGDFNNDGHHDIVSASFNNTSLNFRFGNGAGTFVTGSSYLTGTGTNFISLGDFNNDGNTDVVCSNQSSNTITTRTGNGNGTFAAGIHINVGTSPRAVVICDYNRDGFQDLLVTNYSNNNVQLLTGAGNGTFTNFGSVNVGSGPFGIVAGDFNNDGNADFAVTNYLSNTLSIRLGDGTGNFSSAANVTVGTRPISLAIGDFNGDGKQDLAVANQLSNTVSLCIGDGLGGFVPIPSVDGGSDPNFVVTCDLNHDKREDLLIANYTPNQVIVRMGIESGLTLYSNQNIINDTSTVISSVNNTDFGYVPLNTTSSKTYTLQNSGTFSSTLNNINITGAGASAFTYSGISFPVTVPSGSSITFNLIFNSSIQGNSTANIELMNSCPSSNYSFNIRATGGLPILPSYSVSPVVAGKNLTIYPSSAPINVNSLYATTSHNFNGLISVDPVTGNVFVTNAKPAGTYQVTVNAGTAATTTFTLNVTDPNCSSGSFIFSTSSIATGGSHHWNLAIGDFDKDGNHDIVLPNYSQDSIITMKGNGSGGFTVWSKLKVGLNTYNTAIGDLNGDGNEDIICSNSTSHSLSIRYGNGSGGFTGGDIGVNGGPREVIVGNFNSDIYKDIAIITALPSGVSVLYGDGNGAFYQGNMIPLNQPEALHAGDFNNDGKLDLAVAEYGLDKVIILLNDGNGGFISSDLITGIEPNAIVSADFNRDGNLDLAIANRVGESLSIRFGNGTGSFSGFDINMNFQCTDISSGDFNGDGSQDICMLTPNATFLLGNGNGGFSGSYYTYLPSSANSISVADLNNDNLQDIITSNSSGAICVRLARDSSAVIDGGDNYIYNGSTNVSTSNNTNFENVPIGHSITYSYEFLNIALDTLSIDTIYLTGVNASDFQVAGVNYPFTVFSDSLKKFQVTFTPSAGGVRSAIVHVIYSQCIAKDYYFSVSGTGIIQTLGAYPDTIVQTGDIISVSPQAPPSGFTKLYAYSSADFKGQLTADPVTGILKIINPSPAGAYTIDLYATGFIIQSFQLTVSDPFCGQGNFVSTSPLSLGSQLIKPLTGDFNKDGNLDLAILNNFSVMVRLGNGSGGFTSGSGVNIGATLVDMEIADMNGDGRQDVVAVNSSGYRVCPGDGAGGFSASFNQTIESGTKYVLADDFNNDSRPDILTVYGSGNVALRHQTTTGTFSLRGSTTINGVLGEPEIGDFNNDGFKDIVAPGTQSASVIVAFGNGIGGFTGMNSYPVGNFPTDVAIDDINNDGYEDLLVSNLQVFYVSVFYGNANGTFSAAPNIPVTKIVRSITPGDFNGDGIHDFVANNFSDTSATFYFRDVNGSYLNNRITTGRQPYQSAAGDVNNDGLLDAFILNTATNNLSVLLNAKGDASVAGNNILISDGDSVPSFVDSTDYGNVIIGNQTSRNYTIQNTGLANLNLTDILISGLNSNEFIVTGINFPALIVTGNSITFSVQFSPASSGLRAATVSIISDDCQGNYEFNIQGTGTCPACPINLHLKLFIEGYYQGNGVMAAAVNPWLYPMQCDTVIVELHENSSPYNLLYSDTQTANIYGQVEATFPGGVNGNSYFIVIRHRNALETWSANAIAFTDTIVNYDFTDAITKAFGSNLTDLGDGNFAFWSGDISDAITGVGSQDGIVESHDLSDIKSAIMVILTGYVTEDLTGDWVVESSDFTIVQNNDLFVITSMRP